MAEMIEKGILLTFDELKILLYGSKVTQIEGVYMPEKIFSSQEIAGALNHLSRIGFIKAGEERFHIREDIKEIIGIMAQPDRTGILKPDCAEYPSFFWYVRGEHAVVSEQFGRKKETLRLMLYERNAFERWKEELPDDYCRD